MATYLKIRLPRHSVGRQRRGGLSSHGRRVERHTGTGPDAVRGSERRLHRVRRRGRAPTRFTYKAQNSQGTLSASAATVTLIFPTATGLTVTVLDGQTKTPIAINDYRWIIEEDRTFYVDPNCTTNPPPAGCPTCGTESSRPLGPISTPATCRSWRRAAPDRCPANRARPSSVSLRCAISATAFAGPRPRKQTPVHPSQVALDPTKRYYISVLPGDAANPVPDRKCKPGPRHGRRSDLRPQHGRRSDHLRQTAVTVLAQPTPFPPAKLSVFVFEDDFPLNGEQDAGGGVDVLSPNEPGLGGFNITLLDDAGGSGDATGQVTYDMFNQPLSNSLAGTIDPATGQDACPISQDVAHRCERSDSDRHHRHDRDLPEVRIGRHNSLPAGGPGGGCQPDAGPVRRDRHAGRRPDRTR